MFDGFHWKHVGSMAGGGRPKSDLCRSRLFYFIIIFYFYRYSWHVCRYCLKPFVFFFSIYMKKINIHIYGVRCMEARTRKKFYRKRRKRSDDLHRKRSLHSVRDGDALKKEKGKKKKISFIFSTKTRAGKSHFHCKRHVWRCAREYRKRVRKLNGKKIRPFPPRR